MNEEIMEFIGDIKQTLRKNSRDMLDLKMNDNIKESQVKEIEKILNVHKSCMYALNIRTHCVFGIAMTSVLVSLACILKLAFWS